MTEQVDGVSDAKFTARPDVALALSANGADPCARVANAAKLMV